MPAYTFPTNREDLAALRVVVRNGFSHDLADLLLDDLQAPAAGARGRRSVHQHQDDQAFH